MAAGRWRRFVIRPLVWLVAGLAAAVLAFHLLVDSDLARVRLRDLIEAQVGEALGRTVTIERVAFSLLPIELALDGIVVAGETAALPPFARIEHAEIQAEILGLRSTLVELERVALAGVELNLEFRQDGSDNLPRPPRGRGGRGFELRLGGLFVEQGVVNLSEATLPFAFAAEGVSLRALGIPNGGLDGAVTAREIEVRLPQAQPLRLSLSARARLEGDSLRIVRANLRAADLDLTAGGTVSLRRPIAVDLSTRLRSSGALLDRLGWLHGEIAGEFSFDGEVNWRRGDWRIAGQLESPQLDVIGFQLAELAGRVTGGPGAIALEELTAGWAEGELAGSFAVALERRYPTRLALEVEGARLERVLEQFDLPLRHLDGAVSGPFRYQFDLLDADAGEGGGEVTLVRPEVSTAPIGSALLQLGSGRLRFAELAWAGGSQRVAGSGEIALAGGAGRFDLEVDSRDLGELARMLPFLPPEELWVPSSGGARLGVALELGGRTGGGTRATIDIEAEALMAPGVRADRVVGRLVATERTVELESLLLERPAGRLELNGLIPIGPGAPPLTLTLAVEGWPIEEALPWLPFELPLQGRARGTLELRGSFEALSGAGRLAVDSPLLAGVEGERLRLAFDWDPVQLRVADARLELEAGVVEAEGALELASGALDFRLRAPNLALDKPPLLALGRGVLSGGFDFSARLGGTLDQPALELTGSGRDLVFAGQPLATEPPAALTFALRGERVDLLLDLPEVARVSGGGTLRVGERSRLDLQVASGSIERLAALTSGTLVSGLEGGLEGTIAVELEPEGAITLELSVPSAEFRWQERTIRTLEPVRVRVAGGRLALDSLYLGVANTNDELFLGGTVDLVDDPKLDLHLQADLAGAWFAPIAAGLDLGGRVTLLTDIGGSLARPELRGQGEWSGGRFIPPSLPHSFERGSALVLLYPTAIVLDRLSGGFAGGEVEANGRIELGEGGVGSYRFDTVMRRLNLRWPPGWQLRGDAELVLASTPGGRQIAGAIRLDRAFYFQDLELSPTQLLARLLVKSRVAVPETDETWTTTALNVAVSAPESVRVRNNVADLTASADLTLRGSLARPVLFGQLRTSTGSRVTYSGNKYEIERGVVTFADSSRIDPQLDIVSRTKVDQYDVSLLIGGRVSRPLTTFTSDPPLPDLEILGLLTTGSTGSFSALGSPGSLSGNNSVSVAAEALLYGQAASLVGARVGKLFGFDQVRVEPLTSGDAVSSARVTVGKRLSRKLFVTYSVDSASTAQQILQVEWRLSDALVLVLTQNGNESYSVDARWESRF